jgi:hypothetical protein
MACGEIALGHEVDCDVLPTPGTRPEVYVYNYDDLDAPTVVSGKITAINMKATKVGYKVVGLESCVKKSEDFGRSAVSGLGQYKHKAGLVIYSRTQAIKDGLIKKFGNGRFVFVLKNRGSDADSFEMAGRDVGLRLVPGTIRDQYANDGLFVLSFATPEGEIENENDPMQSVWITDYAATLAMLEATLT